jgi:hypothetical protein
MKACPRMNEDLRRSMKYQNQTNLNQKKGLIKMLALHNLVYAI